MSTGNPEYDVAISGYGPTGQALASLLAARGRKVVVFERWPSLYGLPRLCTLDGEAARIIQAAGDIDEALRDSNPCRRYYLVNQDNKVLIDLDWTAEHVCGYPLRISMHQPDIEVAMDDAARERGAVVHQGCEVTGATQDDGGVTISARRRGGDRDGEEMSVRAKYLVGADGAKSAVREALGIGQEEFPFRNAWLSVDAVRKRTLPTIAGVSEDLRVPVVVCAPEGKTHASIPIGASRLRFEFLVDPDSEHDEHLREEVGYECLQNVHGLTRDDVEIYRQVIYPFAGRIAERWKVGRIFLAGDAAHLMTPFLGQGACSGLRDSANLAWKLDLVLGGNAGEVLLDSYELERKTHVAGHVAGSDALGAMACEPDPEKAAIRDQVFFSGQAPPPPPDPVLTTGVLHLEAAGVLVPPVGDLGPQGRLELDGAAGRGDDVIGAGFQLVGAGVDPGELLDSDQRDFLMLIGGRSLGVGPEAGDGVAADLDGAYGRFMSSHDIEGFLLRPDFTVFAVFRSQDEVPGVVDDLRAQLGSAAVAGAPTAA
jgi:3-(3-hydroxy-phenyl)propionate hydroxylase